MNLPLYSGKELRIHRRVLLRKRVVIERIGKPQAMGQTIDISEGGMAIMLDQLIPGDENITVRLMLDFDPTPIRLDATARVVYCGRSEAHGWFRLGLEFRALPTTQRELIHRFMLLQLAQGNPQANLR